MTARGVIVGAVAVWALFVAGTYLLGEQGEIAVLRTRDATGAEFTTKLWVVDLGDVTWLRVANPQRAWYQRLISNPRVELTRRGRTEARLAIPEPTPEARLAVDEAFAAKYGLMDRWYGLLVRKGAVPIRLVPQTTGP